MGAQVEEEEKERGAPPFGWNWLSSSGVSGALSFSFSFSFFLSPSLSSTSWFLALSYVSSLPLSSTKLEAEGNEGGGETRVLTGEYDIECIVAAS